MKRQTEEIVLEAGTKRRKMDSSIQELYTLDQLNKFSCDELREFLILEGLDHRGLKQTLVGRIYLHQQKQELKKNEIFTISIPSPRTGTLLSLIPSELLPILTAYQIQTIGSTELGLSNRIMLSNLKLIYQVFQNDHNPSK